MLAVLIVSSSKRVVAKTIAQLCKEYDVDPAYVTSIEKEGATLKIESVRSLFPFLMRQHSKNKAIIIYDFETARNETQNALLKMLEEMTHTTLFILVAQDQSRILSTILSRVRVIKPLITSSKGEQKSVTDLIEGQLAKTDKITKEKAIQYIDELVDALRIDSQAKLRAGDKKQAYADALHLKECLQSRALLISNNLNPQMTIDHLILQF